MANILFVLPFYSGDKGQAERLGKWILALNKGKKIDANALLVASYDTTASDLVPLFRQCFRAVATVHQQVGPELEGMGPWPRACNLQFLSVAEFIATNDSFASFDAFYYFEPDNLPLRADWWDMIVADYTAQKRPFWGVMAANIERADGRQWEEGFHMIGTGIYPRDAWTCVPKFAQIRRDNPNRPWDVLARETINPQCCFTDLLVNVHQSRGFRLEGNALTAIYKMPLEAEFSRKQVIIPESAALFHGCKDASLRLIIAKRIGITLTDRLSFLHRGELGDLIYALPAIKYLGGGDIKLAIRQHPQADGTEESRHASVVPLLEAQPYVASVGKYDGGYVDFDFSHFRTFYKSTLNLARCQAEWIGADPECVEQAWLMASPTNRKPSGVIVNRTGRYRRDKFPWKRIVETLGRFIEFIGSDQEHYEFCEDFGSVKRLPVHNLLEIMDRIATSELFIGNQSCCFAIAEGLKHSRIQETCSDAPDCLFRSSNAWYNATEFNSDWPMMKRAPLIPIPDKASNKMTSEDLTLTMAQLRERVRLEFKQDDGFAIFIRHLAKKRRKKGMSCSV